MDGAMGDNWPRRTRGALTAAVIAVAAGLFGAAAGCGTGSTSPLPSTPTTSTSPSSGLPGAAERAGEVRDQTNERTSELEDQVATYAK